MELRIIFSLIGNGSHGHRVWWANYRDLNRFLEGYHIVLVGRENVAKTFTFNRLLCFLAPHIQDALLEKKLRSKAYLFCSEMEYTKYK